jgi:hypothetical protein
MTRLPRIKGRELVRVLERVGSKSCAREAVIFSFDILMAGRLRFRCILAKLSGQDFFAPFSAMLNSPQRNFSGICKQYRAWASEAKASDPV